MKKADDTETLYRIKSRYIKAGPRSCNNFYMLGHYLEDGNGFQGAYLEELSGGSVCFIDRGTYYQLILSIPTGSEYSLPTMDKEICCEFIAYSDGHIGQTECFKQLLTTNGFVQRSVFHESRYCAGQIYVKAKTELPPIISRLEQLNMSLEPARFESKKDIERMISKEIDKYDAISYGELAWEKQIACGNVMAIYHKDKLVAFDFYQPTGSRFVVDPSYRGMHFGYIVKTANFARECWKDSTQWQHAWVESGNGASERTLLQLGYKPTNRLKYRFIRYPEVGESK